MYETVRNQRGLYNLLGLFTAGKITPLGLL